MAAGPEAVNRPYPKHHHAAPAGRESGGAALKLSSEDLQEIEKALSGIAIQARAILRTRNSA